MKRRRYAPAVVLLLLLVHEREPGAEHGPWIVPSVLRVVPGTPPRLPRPDELSVAVDLYNVNFHTRRTFRLFPDGTLDGDDPAALRRFFRCKRSGLTHRMDPGVLSILARLSARYPGHVIEIVSGYRKRGYGVRRSKHFVGRAIDLRVRGVPIARVRNYLWATNDHIGLGHYRRQRFLHVDYRPHEEKVGWVQRRPGRPYHYGPWWAD